MTESTLPFPENLSALPDPDEESARLIILGKLVANPEYYLSVYTSRFDNVLNADDAATLFDEYNADRARYRVVVHPAATWIRDELFRRRLLAPPAERKDHIVFTSGCNAAGKTSGIEYSQARQWAHAIFDSTLSNAMHARSLVDRVLASGRAIAILHIDRPLDEALLAMLDRSRREGRVVRISQIIHSHKGAAETVKSLWDEFRLDPRFHFRFFANSAHGASEGSVELTHLPDYTEVRKNLHELLVAEFRAGRITKSTFDRVRGEGL